MDLIASYFCSCGSQSREVKIFRKKFKRPKNREDSSDFGDFRTKQIVSVQPIFWKIFKRTKRTKRFRKIFEKIRKNFHQSSVNEKSQSQKNHICNFNKCSDRWILKEKFDSIYDLNMFFLGKEQVKQGPQGWKFNCKWMDSKRFKMTYMHLWLLSDCTASEWMHTNIMTMMTTMMMLFGC